MFCSIQPYIQLESEIQNPHVCTALLLCTLTHLGHGDNNIVVACRHAIADIEPESPSVTGLHLHTH